MSDNWGYVVAGYTITATTLVGYVVWLKFRLRRVRRTLPNDNPT